MKYFLKSFCKKKTKHTDKINIIKGTLFPERTIPEKKMINIRMEKNILLEIFCFKTNGRKRANRENL